MTMDKAQAWMAILGVVFTGLTGLITLVFAALASRDAKAAVQGTRESQGALREIHAVVHENFSKQRDEIAAQAREISSLLGVLAVAARAATQAETVRTTLASEAAAVLATPGRPPPETGGTIIKP